MQSCDVSLIQSCAVSLTQSCAVSPRQCCQFAILNQSHAILCCQSHTILCCQSQAILCCQSHTIMCCQSQTILCCQSQTMLSVSCTPESVSCNPVLSHTILCCQSHTILCCLTQSCAVSLTQSCAVSLTQSCSVSLIQSCAVSLIQSCAVSLIQSCAVSLTQSCAVRFTPFPTPAPLPNTFRQHKLHRLHTHKSLAFLTQQRGTMRRVYPTKCTQTHPWLFSAQTKAKKKLEGAATVWNWARSEGNTARKRQHLSNSESLTGVWPNAHKQRKGVSNELGSYNHCKWFFALLHNAREERWEVNLHPGVSQDKNVRGQAWYGGVQLWATYIKNKQKWKRKGEREREREREREGRDIHTYHTKKCADDNWYHHVVWCTTDFTAAACHSSDLATPTQYPHTWLIWTTEAATLYPNTQN